MDRIFAKKVGHNIEVYVDDMVVKSVDAEHHCPDLQSIFDSLRQYELKLNLEKSAFRVHAGKFLGFMLTTRGIKANLDKCRAIIEMRS